MNPWMTVWPVNSFCLPQCPIPGFGIKDSHWTAFPWIKTGKYFYDLTEEQIDRVAVEDGFLEFFKNYRDYPVAGEIMENEKTVV